MKTYLLSLSILITITATAQEIQQAREDIYYERYRSACGKLHRVIASEPSLPEAWYWLTEACLEAGDTVRLKDSLLLAPADIRQQPFYEVAYAHLLLATGLKDSAAILFNDALQRTKQKDPGVLAAVARAHITSKTGDASYAIELLQKAMKRDKKDPALAVLLGDAYRKLNNGSEAFKAYQQALEKNGKYAAAQYKLAKIFIAQKNPSIYLNYLNNAIASDPQYGPAYFELYYYYYFIDPSKALDAFTKYMALSDPGTENQYLYVDLLYLTKQYPLAVAKAQDLIAAAGDTIPRLYKLIAYSYLGQEDTTAGMSYMKQYFTKDNDSSYVFRDFETMGQLYFRNGQEDSAAIYFEKATAKAPDSTIRYSLYKKLADLYKREKDFHNRAHWLGKYYENNDRATNLDLFNWGLSHFRADEYQQADSVFAIYTSKYPDQTFGYYWRARSNALMDSTSELGLAFPHYKQLITMLEADSSGNKKWLIEAYGYLAAYETNKEKNYPEAISYLQKILAIEPDNKDARKYISVLEKNITAAGKKQESKDN